MRAEKEQKAGAQSSAEEMEKLLSTVTAERDQLRTDLQENAQMVSDCIDFLKVKMTTKTVLSSLTTTEFRVILFSLLKAFQAHNLCFISSLLLLLVCVFSSSLNSWFTVPCSCFDLHYILLFLGCRDTSSSTVSSRRPPRAEAEELGSGETL